MAATDPRYPDSGNTSAAIGRARSRVPLLRIAAPLCAAIILLGGCGQTKAEKAALAKLAPKTSEFAAASGKPSVRSPRLRGRIVPINSDKRKIDKGVFNGLPAGLQARSPEDVSTVVLIKYREEVVGKYADGAKAKQEFANLTIVDLVSHAQYKGRVDGPDPPLKKVGRGDKSGGAVYSADVSRYLEELPRVNASR